MSDRTISEIHEVKNGSITEVIVTSTDENGNSYVGTGSYVNDDWRCDSQRDEAYKNATDESLNG